MNQSVTDLQTQIQSLMELWDWVNYFYKINESIDGIHVTIWYDLTTWFNTFPDSQQIINKMANGRYRVFINSIQDSGKPITAYINDYSYDANTKRLSIEYSSTGHAVLV